MLFIGNHTTILKHENVVVYNVHSLIEGYERLDVLPYQANQFFNDDIYFNLLLNDNYKFMQMMKVVMTLYDGFHVYLIVDRVNEYIDEVIESFLKFIQLRYGYNYFIINDMDDYLNISHRETDFSIQGVYNLDIDKERFTYLQAKIASGGGNNVHIPDNITFIR